MIEACKTQVFAATGLEHSVMRQEGKRIGTYKSAYFIYIIAVADEFLRSMYVHTIIACILERGTSDTYVNLGCTGR